MLELEIDEKEVFDDRSQTFVNVPKQTLRLEHSLLSIAKWESKWHVPYLANGTKTVAQAIDYVRCMTIGKAPSIEVYETLSPNEMDQITEYIEDSMTATWFSNSRGKPSREIITSELIYYWMIEFGIPFECDKWHLNRLLTLIRICQIKNSPKKKMSANELAARNRKLNQARKSSLNTKG